MEGHGGANCEMWEFELLRVLFLMYLCMLNMLDKDTFICCIFYAIYKKKKIPLFFINMYEKFSMYVCMVTACARRVVTSSVRGGRTSQSPTSAGKLPALGKGREEVSFVF